MVKCVSIRIHFILKRIMKSCIFLFSLPRSGSTYLQRIFATSNDIYTTDEPWLMLPLLYPLNNKIYAPYGDLDTKRAINDFFTKYDIGDYKKKIIAGACDYYTSLTGESRFFLDKTPRNLLISKDICLYAPKETKFVFLVRHPLAVLASMFDTWGKGAWIYHKYKIDLEISTKELYLAIKEFANLDSSVVVKYEDIVKYPDKTEQELSDFLNVHIDSKSYSTIKLDGIMGDPNRHNKIVKSKKNIDDAWVSIIKNSLRKKLLIKYVKFLGEDLFTLFGYDYSDTLNKIQTTNVDKQEKLLIDIKNILVGFIYNRFQPRIIFDSILKPLRKESSYIYR